MSSTLTVQHQTWQAFQPTIEQRLNSYMDALLQTKFSGASTDCPPQLQEAMAYSLMAGGKRLRPTLVLMAAEACGGEVESALPAACAIEMVHTYSLIHDDLPAMDDDDLRRGRKTNHIEFGEATAILAGDALLTYAFEILVKEVKPYTAAAACCGELAFAAGACGMVGGQVADLEAEETNWSKYEDTDQAARHLESIHRRKTGCLITCALRMGAHVANADQKRLEALDHYGKSVGLAFQIADDLLDISSDAVKMGKETQKDADHGKLTYPGLWGVDVSRQRAAALVEDARRWIQPLGENGRQLDALARYVVEREN